MDKVNAQSNNYVEIIENNFDLKKETFQFV